MYLRQKLEGEVYDRVFFPAEIGAVKTNPLFWEYVIHQLKNDSPALAESEVLYIDDKENNIATAKPFGLSTYVYNGDLLALKNYFFSFDNNGRRLL